MTEENVLLLLSFTPLMVNLGFHARLGVSDHRLRPVKCINAHTFVIGGVVSGFNCPLPLQNHSHRHTRAVHTGPLTWIPSGESWRSPVTS